MIGALALFVTVALAPQQQDSTYANAAVRTIVERAAAVNRSVPAQLGGYRAHIEAEVAIVAHQPDGAEGAVQVEQTANEAVWSRDGSYEQHVVGYRSRMLGPSISLLSGLRFAWTVPTLYGNRIDLFFGRDTGRRPERRRSNAPRYRAVHPFATDRESVYRFSGGDTVSRVTVNGRRVIVVRVHVEPLTVPRSSPTAPTIAFAGDVDVDLARAQIVSMRGRFLELVPRPQGVATRLLASTVRGIAYVELSNAEVVEHFWLPVYQRVELQGSTIFSEVRGIVRVVSRFSDYAIDITTAPLIASAPDSLALRPHRLTWAPRDSLDRYSASAGAWRRTQGEETSRTNGDDFLDVAPPELRPTGPPELRWRARHFSDVFHMNRVEGAFTGYGAELRLRDAAPGVTLRGQAGWAWSEKTARGAVEAEVLRNAWLVSVHAGRTLAQTNDFTPAFENGTTVSAIFGSDDYDYVDRRDVTLTLGHELSTGRSALRIETGVGGDRAEVRRLASGPLGRDTFRVNRPVTAGNYRRTAVTLDWNPSVTGEFLETGVGGSAHYERADGGLTWQRAELRVMTRENRGELTMAARVDAGMTNAAAPPQQLFELGGARTLDGYAYKEFIGDRAALARGLAYYTLPIFRAPIRLWRFLVPGVAPAPSVDVDAGWTDVAPRTARALDTIYGAGAWRTTDGVRSTVALGLRFFGGAIDVAMARPLDHRAGWTLQTTIGGSW